MLQFLAALDWQYVFALLFILSEFLGLNPKIKSSSIFQLCYAVLKDLLVKKPVVAMVEAAKKDEQPPAV